MKQDLLTAMKALKEKKTYMNYLLLEDMLKEEKSGHCVKIAILRNYTTEMLTPVIVGEVALSGDLPRLTAGEYDTICQEVLDERGWVYSFDPEFILIALWPETLSPKLYVSFNSLSLEEIQLECDRVVSEIRAMIAAVRQHSSAAILINNFVYPERSSLGIFDLQTDFSQMKAIVDLNRRLYQLAESYRNVYIVDILSIFYRMGFDQAFDKKSWAMSKNPFTKNALLEIGAEYGKYIKSMRGKLKKCIVFDCDHTLWGGVVGELGARHIVLGETYPGICYKNLQREILNLYHQGIMIALCSKNNEADVLEVLRDNEEMLLKEEHLVAYEINWNDKAENILKLSKKLNIGLDSMVFVDDSAFECNLVKKVLPSVEVIHLYMEPSGYASAIRNCGLFNYLVRSEDDKNRTRNYQAERVRDEMKRHAESIDEYLAGLGMQVGIRVDYVKDIGRISQLTQKTNQFNITTNRYNEEQIERMMADSSYSVLSISVKDEVSDLGIIGVGIFHYVEDTVEIDTFLLSCRALGRNLEDVLFKAGMDLALERNCASVCARYKKTEKNKQVSDLFDRYGVKRVQRDEVGNAIWKDKIPTVRVPTYFNLEICAKENVT